MLVESTDTVPSSREFLKLTTCSLVKCRRSVSHLFFITSLHECLLFPIKGSKFLSRDVPQCKARSCDRMSSVRPSVRLSVTLVDCDHIGSNSSKIISRLVSVGRSLSTDANIMDLLQGEQPEIGVQSDPPLLI